VVRPVAVFPANRPLAGRQNRPQRYLLRANKLLASMKWSGSDYHSRFQTAAEMQTALDAMGARLLVVGPYPPHRPKRRHHSPSR